MKANALSTCDMIGESTYRDLALKLAFHGNWRQRDTRRPNDYARRLFKASGLEFVDLWRVLECRLVHSISKGQRHQIGDKLPRVPDVHISILERHPIGAVLDGDRQDRRLSPDAGKESKRRKILHPVRG